MTSAGTSVRKAAVLSDTDESRINENRLWKDIWQHL